MSISTTEKKASATPVQSRQTRWSMKRRITVTLLVVLVLMVISAGTYWFLRPRVRPLAIPTIPAHLSWADMGLQNWQEYQQPLPVHPLDAATLPASPEVDSQSALLQDAAGQALVQKQDLDRGIAYMKAAVLAVPMNLRYANDLRIVLRDHRRFAEEEQFFSEQDARLKTPESALNLALVYVDEMRSCPKPPDGLVCQAQYSSRSISTLNTVIAAHPYNIIALYARGLNNLYWPTLMGHLPKSQEDLELVVALTRKQHDINTLFTPQAYTALGDVFAKDGKPDDGRNVWLNGLEISANDPLLTGRLAIPQDQLQSEEEHGLRGLGVYVDTDIAVFWRKGA